MIILGPWAIGNYGTFGSHPCSFTNSKLDLAHSKGFIFHAYRGNQKGLIVV